MRAEYIKAKELVDKMKFQIEWYELHGTRAMAKQCALICVNEILEATKERIWSVSDNDDTDAILESFKYDEFYQDVKDQLK
jgi:hypothetical protein